MKTNNNLWKSITFSLGLTLALLVSKTSIAQYGGRHNSYNWKEGVFDNMYSVDPYYFDNLADRFELIFEDMYDLQLIESRLMEQMRGLGVDDDNGVGISNYGIGETVPLGGGVAILLATSLGYVAFKKKEKGHE